MTSGGSQHSPCPTASSIPAADEELRFDACGSLGVWEAPALMSSSRVRTPHRASIGARPSGVDPTYAPHRETRRFVGGSSGCLLRLKACY
jgi:hypothetical protein